MKHDGDLSFNLRWIDVFALPGLLSGHLISGLARYDVDHFRDRFRRDRMVASDHDHFDAGQSALLHGNWHRCSGWIDERNQTQKSVALFGYLRIAELNFVVGLEAVQLFVAKADYSLAVATDRIVDLMKSVHELLVDLPFFTIQIVGRTFLDDRLASALHQRGDLFGSHVTHHGHAELVRRVERHDEDLLVVTAKLLHRADRVFGKSQYGHLGRVAQRWPVIRGERRC